MTSPALTTAPAAPARAPAVALSRVARAWMWGLIPAFAVHDGEEALVIVRDGGMRAFGRWETTSQCLAGILLEFSIGWIVTLLATRPGASRRAVEVYVALLGGWTLHGAGHLLDGAVSDGYAFGAVTAMPGCVVFGLLALGRLRAEGVMTTRRALGLTALGVAALPVLILSAHLFGRVVS